MSSPTPIKTKELNKCCLAGSLLIVRYCYSVAVEAARRIDETLQDVSRSQSVPQSSECQSKKKTALHTEAIKTHILRINCDAELTPNSRQQAETTY
ncbi:hypothetical protein P8452_58873 [Trifolium repens]|nr:hypothetical protein P8452_58873 [Trifolium repens]